MTELKTRRRLVIASSLAVVLAGAGTAFGWLADRESDTCTNRSSCVGGPLGWDSPGLVTNSFGSRSLSQVGEVVSSDSLALRNWGAKNLVLQRAWLVHRQTGIKLLGLYTRSFPEQRLIGYRADYTPRMGQPVAGRHVRPQQELTVVFGVRLVKPGKQAFRGIAIEYRVGERMYVKTFDVYHRFCSPASDYTLKTCLPPPEDPGSPRFLPIGDTKPTTTLP